MKNVSLFIFALFVAFVINAQERVNLNTDQFPQMETVDCEDGKMLHDYLNPNTYYDQDNYELGSSPEGDYPGDMLYSADGSKIFIANSYSNNITILNADGTVSDNILVGSYPITLALNDNFAVVPCSMSSDVYILDLSDNSIAATINTDFHISKRPLKIRR